VALLPLLPREEEIQKVLELYDTYVWGPLRKSLQRPSWTISLLLRLELRGVDVDDRWEELGLPYHANP